MQHTARLRWTRTRDDHQVKTYSRDHQVAFDSGVTITGSAANSPSQPPNTVGASTVDPEELVVAAAASCHMLFFLTLSAKRGLVVDRYDDDPVGVLGTQDGVTLLTHITLHPRVTWHGDAPPADVIAELHHESHVRCYIANSLKTEVTVSSD